MPDSESFAGRLKKGVVRIDAEVPGGGEADALAALRRSFVQSIARLEPGSSAGKPAFRFQLTGGRPLLFQGDEALPMEPYALCRLLNLMEVQLQGDESLDLDGALAAWMIRPEVNLTDTHLRHAEETLRTLRSVRDRDHSASQTAESLKVRLRSRLTHLVGALEVAQRDPAATA